MTDSTKAGLRCPICGETAPEPAWICLPRLSGTAEPGRRCNDSVEGVERIRAEMQAIEDARLSRARAAGIPANEATED